MVSTPPILLFIVSQWQEENGYFIALFALVQTSENERIAVSHVCLHITLQQACCLRSTKVVLDGERCHPLLSYFQFVFIEDQTRMEPFDGMKSSLEEESDTVLMAPLLVL